MKFKTTKELINQLEDKSAFWLMWAVVWRGYFALLVISEGFFGAL